MMRLELPGQERMENLESWLGDLERGVRGSPDGGNFRVLPSRFSSARLGGHGELERPAWRIGYSQAGAIANNRSFNQIRGIILVSRCV